jgi:hypothetical protein
MLRILEPPPSDVREGQLDAIQTNLWQFALAFLRSSEFDAPDTGSRNLGLRSTSLHFRCNRNKMSGGCVMLIEDKKG